jgi:hypothetical protein
MVHLRSSAALSLRMGRDWRSPERIGCGRR